jgi:hypothetical protein
MDWSTVDLSALILTIVIGIVLILISPLIHATLLKKWKRTKISHLGIGLIVYGTIPGGSQIMNNFVEHGKPVIAILVFFATVICMMGLLMLTFWVTQKLIEPHFPQSANNPNLEP